MDRVPDIRSKPQRIVLPAVGPGLEADEALTEQAFAQVEPDGWPDSVDRSGLALDILRLLANEAAHPSCVVRNVITQATTAFDKVKRGKLIEDCGDLAAIKEIFDRLEGKASQRIVGPDDGPVKVEPPSSSPQYRL
ncbi:MAG: hypothetical protein ACXU9D_18530 [Xanthobacteraceae bacterium]